jgi:hypothetical protein
MARTERRTEEGDAGLSYREALVALLSGALARAEEGVAGLSGVLTDVSEGGKTHAFAEGGTAAEVMNAVLAATDYLSAAIMLATRAEEVAEAGRTPVQVLRRGGEPDDAVDPDFVPSTHGIAPAPRLVWNVNGQIVAARTQEEAEGAWLNDSLVEHLPGRPIITVPVDADESLMVRVGGSHKQQARPLEMYSEHELDSLIRAGVVQAVIYRGTALSLVRALYVAGVHGPVCVGVGAGTEADWKGIPYRVVRLGDPLLRQVFDARQEARRSGLRKRSSL